MAELLYQRDVYGQALVELGKQNKNIVVLDADLSGSTRTSIFAKAFPDRFFNVGVAEQNLITIAAGLASCGKTVFVSSFAMFATGRCWDQVRNSLCYNNFNVKIVATHAGISVGPDGASHQAIEDIALMRVIPTMNVIVPCDGPQTREALMASVENKGPFYIRLGRAKVPTLSDNNVFEFGKAQVLRKGKDVVIAACGIMVQIALEAATSLQASGIQATVLNIHTVKPLDIETILACVQGTRGMVVCEEHSVSGGLASAIAEMVSEVRPCRIARVGVRNKFGQSGEPDELLREYHLTSNAIQEAVHSLIA
jgi:transketolase